LALVRIKEYKAVLVSSFEFMGAELQFKLVEYAKSGGTVVLGPILPHLDEKMFTDTTILDALAGGSVKPLTSNGETLGTVYTIGEGQFVHLPQLLDAEKTLEVIFTSLNAVKIEKNDVRLDLTVHELPEDNKKKLVFVCNPSADVIDAKVGIGVSFKKVTEIWSGKEAKVDGSVWSDAMPAYTIKIYECEG
jgi:beta-galactosidase